MSNHTDYPYAKHRGLNSSTRTGLLSPARRSPALRGGGVSKQPRYIGTPNHPYHLSVGAVLVNDKGEIATHHYPKRRDFPDWPACYVLMRETVENDESLERALRRGLKEEFGARGKTVAYLGSILCSFPRKGVRIEKTMLYFLVRCTSFQPQQRSFDDPENDGAIEWHRPRFYIPRMRRQRHHREDIDESLIVQRAAEYL